MQNPRHKAWIDTIPISISGPSGPWIKLDRLDATRFSALKLSGGSFQKGEKLEIIFGER